VLSLPSRFAYKFSPAAQLNAVASDILANASLSVLLLPTASRHCRVFFLQAFHMPSLWAAPQH
jgi:hypothetical protein